MTPAAEVLGVRRTRAGRRVPAARLASDRPESATNPRRSWWVVRTRVWWGVTESFSIAKLPESVQAESPAQGSWRGTRPRSAKRISTVWQSLTAGAAAPLATTSRSSPASMVVRRTRIAAPTSSALVMNPRPRVCACRQAARSTTTAPARRCAPRASSAAAVGTLKTPWQWRLAANPRKTSAAPATSATRLLTLCA